MKPHGFTLLPALIFLIMGGLTSALLYQETGPEGDSEDALLRLSGAVRIFFTNALWMRMSTHLHEGKEGLVLADARTLLRLEPNNLKLRSFLHFHLAFNMARKAVNDAARAEWINEGLEIMDNGLLRHPDAWELNHELGMTFFLRTGRSELFEKICLERYGHLPVELAPIHFEQAYHKEKEDVTLVGLYLSLLNAACHDMEQERYDSASRRWTKVLRYLTPGLDKVEEEADREAFQGLFEDLLAYCTLKSRAEKGEEISGEDVKKIQDLWRDIQENPFYEFLEEKDRSEP
jgi:hypothetical protein